MMTDPTTGLAISVAYDADRQGFDVTLDNGVVMHVPRGLIPDLTHSRSSTLTKVQIGADRSSLVWPTIRARFDLTGLDGWRTARSAEVNALMNKVQRG